MPTYGAGTYGSGWYGGAAAGGTAYPYDNPGWGGALATLSSAQDALDARSTTPRGAVYIGGVLTPYVGFSVQFRAGQTATGRITLPLPRPAQVVANAAVTIQGGHNDLVGTYFSGYIPRWTSAMTARGDTLEVQLVGHSRRLTEPYREDVTWRGPVDAGQVFADLCTRSGVPSYIAYAALFPDGSALTLGGNPNVDDGAITITANSSPLGQLQRLVEPYAYHVTDTPSGAVLFHRVLGIPSETPVVAFAEGVHLGDTRREYDATEIVNVPDVQGVTYTDVWGGQVPIRSIADPSAVEPSAEIIGGYRYRITSNSDIVRPDQADAARNVLEINGSEASAPVAWDAVAVPFLSPGDVVEVTSETVEASGRYWLMAMDLTDDEGGATARYDAWAGAGDAYPGIVDRTVIPIQTGVTHLGDETRWNYAHPAPEGAEKSWSVTIPKRATAVNVRLLVHGSNSQLQDGVDNTELAVSKFELWRDGEDRAESSGNLPVLPENILTPRDYTDIANWSPAAINLSNTDEGNVTLKLIAGESAGLDDFEVQDIYLEIWGLTMAAGA